jgi:large subunit ribosomal protein L23
MNEHNIIIRPIITEKTTQLKYDYNLLCFEVDERVNKIEIKKAVEKLFNVKVDSVRIVHVKPKKKRLGRFEGKRPGWKKAYVKLKKGEKAIEYFERT